MCSVVRGSVKNERRVFSQPLQYDYLICFWNISKYWRTCTEIRLNQFAACCSRLRPVKGETLIWLCVNCPEANGPVAKRYMLWASVRGASTWCHRVHIIMLLGVIMALPAPATESFFIFSFSCPLKFKWTQCPKRHRARRCCGWLAVWATSMYLYSTGPSVTERYTCMHNLLNNTKARYINKQKNTCNTTASDYSGFYVG